MSPRPTLYLIDANAYVHRAYHALPPLTNSHGEPVQALYGFARMLQKLLRQENPDHIVVCFDTPAPTFRHKAFAAYKANRKETDDALKFQLPLARQMAEAWGFPVVAVEGFESDDLIATLADKAAKKGMNAVVVTGDKDALQLVNEHISVLNEFQSVTYHPADVEKKYGLRPDQLVDYFALTGDASDNVPGVPGIGPKTATQILHQFGTLDDALARTREMKDTLRNKLEEHREDALLSRDLVVLNRKVPVPLEPSECLRKTPDRPALTALLRRFEFNSFLDEVAAQEPAARKKPLKVEILRTEKDLHAAVSTFRDSKELGIGVVAIGPSALHAHIVGLALSAGPGAAYYLPVGHSYLGCPAQLPLSSVRDNLSEVLANEKIHKTGHNLKFISLALHRHGVPFQGLGFDILVASYCLNPARVAQNLNALCRDLLGEDLPALPAAEGKKGAKETPPDQMEIPILAEHAAAEAEAALRLRKKMGPLLREKDLHALYFDIELPLVSVLARMEETGIKIDVPYLKGLAREFAAEIAEHEKTIYTLAGETLNLNSPKQLAVLLFEKLKLPVIRRTKTGYSTDEEVLQKLSALHPLPAKLVEYRELSKLKSTFIDALLQLVDPADGRIHTSFNQAVTATGRLSSSDPNLQNIPVRTPHGRRIRQAFVADKGGLLLSADYSQIDLRVLAHVSQDPVLCEAFRHGEDIHAATARELFGLKKGETPTEDQRRVAKTVNFGIVYGQTGFGLAQQIGIPVAEAQRYIDRYFARYAGVHRWIEKILEQARRDGHVTTLLHRIRYLPEIKAPNAAVRQFAERTAMNTPIQGTSADIIKVAMRDLAEWLQTEKHRTRMLLQVHDELLFEVPREEFDAVAAPIRRKMEEAVRLDIPLVVDLKKGVNWFEMEKIPAEKK